MITAGETRSDKITIRNTGATALTISLSVERFEVANEQYDYRFGAGKASDWVRFVDQEFLLQPNQEREAAYSVAIPTNASPGGYYFAIFAAGEPPQANDAIREVKRVASMVYLEVPGAVSREGRIVGVSLPWLTTNRQTSYELRLINQGNTHFDIDARLGLSRLIGGSMGERQLTGLLLPGTIRNLSGSLDLPTWPGLYRLQGRVGFPDGAQNLPDRYILYMPVWFMLLIAVVLIWTAYWVWRRRTPKPKPNPSQF